MSNAMIRTEGLTKHFGRGERKVEAVLGELGISVPERETDVPEEVIDCLRQGNKIAAIKFYRETTGASLKEAKKAVEEIANRYGLS